MPTTAASVPPAAARTASSVPRPAGVPTVEASSTRAATPRAVPSWAAVLRTPVAVETCSSGRSVPRSLQATDEMPRPSPRRSRPTVVARVCPSASATTPLPAPSRDRPTAMAPRAPRRRVTCPASIEPGTTETLRGSSANPAWNADRPSVSCRCSVRSTAVELVAAVFTNDPTEPAARRGRRRVESRRIGDLLRCSQATSSTPSRTAAATVQPPSVRRDGSWRNDAPSTAAMTVPVSSAAPTTSTRAARSVAGRAWTQASTPAPSRTAIGMLTQKTDRHPRVSVRKPPRNSPVAPAVAPAALHSPSARVRSSDVPAVARRRLSAAGTVSAEAVPCTARASTSCHPACAAQPSPPAAAKTASPETRTRR